MKIKLKINKKYKSKKDNDHNGIDNDEIKNCLNNLKEIFNKNNELEELDLEKTLHKEEEDKDNQEVAFLKNQIKFYKKRLLRKDELIEELSPRYKNKNNSYS